MVTRPNIIVIHAHDLGRHLHCYGIDEVRSPNLDRLAAEGVRFARAFTVCPTCSPSRAVLWTGLYPPRNGVMGMCPGRMQWDLKPDVQHLAQRLKAAGYATAGVGVHHESHSGPTRCGFDTWDDPMMAAPAVDAAITRLGALAAAPEPFYLQVGLFEPHRIHLPGQETDGFIGEHIQPLDDNGVYVPGYLQDTPGTIEELAELQGAVAHMDAQVGRLLVAVDEQGLRDSTLILFTTDHGIAMPRSKATLYDPGIETALLVRLPGTAAAGGGKVVSELVSNVDVLPTLLELAGLEPPEDVDGVSFARLLVGGAGQARREVFCEQTYHGQYDARRGLRTERYKLVLFFSSGHTWQDVSQSWRPRSDPRVSRRGSRPDMELFDLAEDPWEETNLADDPTFADVRDELLARLHAHLKRTGDPILRGAVDSPTHHIALALLRGRR